jgi:ABC-2 type transport system ATP-binding protein
VAALSALDGVRSVQASGQQLSIALADAAQAAAVLGWLVGQGVTLLHFATAKTSLENIFLNLTGRCCATDHHDCSDSFDPQGCETVSAR